MEGQLKVINLKINKIVDVYFQHYFMELYGFLIQSITVPSCLLRKGRCVPFPLLYLINSRLFSKAQLIYLEEHTDKNKDTFFKIND